MARSNVSSPQQAIECSEMSELVLQHPLQGLNAARMKQASNGNLAAIDPDRTALAGVIDAQNPIDGLSFGYAMPWYWTVAIVTCIGSPFCNAHCGCTGTPTRRPF
jgi:hypothetical protein